MLEYIDIKIQKQNMLKKLKRKRAEKRAKHYFLRNKKSAYDEAVISWIAPETIKHERGLMWKVLMTIFLCVSIVGGFYYDSASFSGVIIALVLVYYLAHLEHPKDVEVKISKIGIKVGSRKYPYSRIQAFWLIYEPPYTQTLNIRVTGEFVSDITIQLDGQSPSPVREFLIEKIPELEGQTEKISDIILRILKI